MSYTVQKGDTLSQIAKRHGISLRALIAANPKIKNANMIRIDQKINVPEAKKAGDPKVSGSKTSNPYKRMSRTQMAMMDSKNKNKGAQESATRSIRKAITQGAEGRDRDAARKMEDPRGERSAMDAKMARAKAAYKPKTAGKATNQKDPRGERAAMEAKKEQAKAAYKRRRKKSMLRGRNRRRNNDG